MNGIRHLVEDGETGLLVPPGEPDALADVLERVLAGPGLRVRVGMAVRDRIIREFSMERMVAEKQRLYLALAEAR